MDTIVKLLKQNARLSNKELAAMTGLSEAEVAAAIKEYESKGVIKGYSAILNDDLADKDRVTAFIEVKVTPKAEYGFDDIARTIMMYDEVESLTLMSGAFDLAVTISGTNYKEIALFVARRLSTIDGVLSTSTHFFLKRYKEKGIFIDDEETDERSFVSP
ncbi:MAG: Lrp/AsnC family transcriptional regulator [Oscillospiraceae bacterium]|nr:Lrp/AsnC family transcriptional regulator [Oscillospiraceae bacterium]